MIFVLAADGRERATLFAFRRATPALRFARRALRADLFRKADELMYENKAKLKANRPAGFSIR